MGVNDGVGLFFLIMRILFWTPSGRAELRFRTAAATVFLFLFFFFFYQPNPPVALYLCLGILIDYNAQYASKRGQTPNIIRTEVWFFYYFFIILLAAHAKW